MKLAIVGSRNFKDYKLVKSSILKYYPISLIDKIVSGGAIGADFFGKEFAKEFNIQLSEFLPDWDKYGKRAGFIRNEDIIKNCDEVIAFWNGESKGTANSLAIAKRLKKPTIIIYF